MLEFIMTKKEESSGLAVRKLETFSAFCDARWTASSVSSVSSCEEVVVGNRDTLRGAHTFEWY